MRHAEQRKALRTRSLESVAAAATLGFGVVALLVACGDSGADSLMSGRGAGGNAAGGGPGAGTVTGTSTGGDPGLGGTLPDGAPLTEAGILQNKAESMFRALQPQLVATCGGPGGACHVAGAYQNGQTPVWLGNPDPYDSIKKYPGIIVPDPYSSKLMIKGPHAGPDFSGPKKALGDAVLQWLTEEALAIKATPLPSSDAFSVQAGANSVDVSKAGKGIDGAKVTFNAAISGTILTLTSLSISAPQGTGLHVAHPVFAIVEQGKDDQPDPVDSLSNVDQQVAAATTTALGSGTLILEGFAAGAQLKIEFTKIDPANVAGGDAGTTGGCKSVASFTANAVPAIQNNQCLNCHGNSGGSGYGSLDLSQVGKNDTAACAQALTRVNLGNKAQSDIILAPTGGVGAHPFQGADANYKTMMLNWINNE